MRRKEDGIWKFGLSSQGDIPQAFLSEKDECGVQKVNTNTQKVDTSLFVISTVHGQAEEGVVQDSGRKS